MKRFIRTIEDFICTQCGQEVKGSGFTNHCPRCLWSKHVDVHPGDRQATCGGGMPPVSLEVLGSESIITHQCATCGHRKRNKVSPLDEAGAIIELSKKIK